MTRVTKLHEFTCLNCGKQSTGNRIDKHFCSRACIERYRYWNRRDGATRAESREGKVCEHCGGAFTGNRADQRFCSVRCQRRAHYLRTKDRYAEYQREFRRRNPKAGMSYRHGTDWNELVAALWKLQDGKCYLCADPLDREKLRGFGLDHDHSCCKYGFSCPICRRGLACPDCNILIGHAKDDPDRLRRIADNLEVANALVRQRQEAAA